MYLKFIVSTGTNFYLNKETRFLEKFPCLFTTSSTFPVMGLRRISTGSFSSPLFETFPCAWQYCRVVGRLRGWARGSTSALSPSWFFGAFPHTQLLLMGRQGPRDTPSPPAKSWGCWWAIRETGEPSERLAKLKNCYKNFFCHLFRLSKSAFWVLVLNLHCIKLAGIGLRLWASDWHRSLFPPGFQPLAMVHSWCGQKLWPCVLLLLCHFQH